MTARATNLAGSTLPVRRASNEFIVETLAGEVLVYDQVQHRAHCLTPAGALVWNLCDGKASRATASAALRAAGASEDLDQILAQLGTAQLVTSTPVSRRRGVNRSRRAVLSKSAVAAGLVLASPVVFSIVSPSVAEAASVGCGKLGQPCCAPGNTCDLPLSCKSGSCG